MEPIGKSLCKSEYGGLSLSLYDNLDYVKPLWQKFEETALLTPFQTTSWLYQWHCHIGTLEQVKPLVVVVEDGAGPLIILPLQIEKGVLRKLSWLGSDLNDYNCPLIAQDYWARAKGLSTVDIWRQVLVLINAQAGFQHDYIRLEKMPDQICGQANPMIALGTKLGASHAYRTQMEGNFDEFYTSKRSSKSKSKDRYSRRKLAELGNLSMVCPDEVLGIRGVVDTLIEQKSARFEQMGVENFFQKPGYMDFYRAVAAEQRDLIHVSELRVGDKTAAANFGLTFRGAYYYVLTSYAQGETSRFSPGTVHLLDVMKLFIEKGFNAFDFTIGDEPYKVEWCDGKNALYDHMDASTMQGRAALAYWQAFQSTKRYIKQTPSLWNAYSKLRSVLGARKAG